MTNGKKRNPTIEKIKRLSEQRWFVHVLPILFLVLLIGLFTVLTKGRFADPKNVTSVFKQVLIIGTVATGASFIFASGNVNLAMGATTVLTATLACIAYNATGSTAVMILTAIGVGVALMAAAALLSTLLNVQVMYVTIVMMTMLKAIQESLLKGGMLSVDYSLVERMDHAQFSTILFVLYFVIAIILFHYTEIGRALKMIGTNRTCADQTGIREKAHLLNAFIIAGAGCGVGALMIVQRAGAVGPNTLSGMNTDVMLALVLGGMSIFGGSKSFAYAGVIGALTVVVLNQGLLMIGVDSTVIQAIRGIIFLTLIFVSQQRPKGLPAQEG